MIDDGMDFSRSTRRTKEISLVPMIDVGFFLLFFFMISGTIQKFEILPVEVPFADSGKLLDEGEVVIMLGQYDEIVMGDELVTMEEFVPALAEKLQKNPNLVISLKADSRLPATRLLQTMDSIRSAGGVNLSLVTQSQIR